MKSIEKVRNRLNRAISSGDSKDVILSISRHLDELIVERMKVQNKKYISKGQ
ncbi:MAG: aspartyl-phosphate phosphatase Spo0E family protein [Clostridia bacterium]|nr:aspartyl-phosphate phosphatase Spo0E family protein [Clostridia bacterium]